MATVDHMVSRALGATLSPDAATRGEAELYLKKCERTAGFPALLLDLARAKGGEAAAAATYLKNFISAGWDARTAADGATPVADAERAAIRSGLLDAVCAAGGGPVAAQLSRALVLVADRDFPARWPELLPDLVRRIEGTLEAGDAPGAAIVLSAANGVLKRFRYKEKRRTRSTPSSSTSSTRSLRR